MLNLSLPSGEGRKTAAAPSCLPAGPAWVPAARPLLQALSLQFREYGGRQRFVAVLLGTNLSVALG